MDYIKFRHRNLMHLFVMNIHVPVMQVFPNRFCQIQQNSNQNIKRPGGLCFHEYHQFIPKHECQIIIQMVRDHRFDGDNRQFICGYIRYLRMYCLKQLKSVFVVRKKINKTVFLTSRFTKSDIRRSPSFLDLFHRPDYTAIRLI